MKTKIYGSKPQSPIIKSNFISIDKIRLVFFNTILLNILLASCNQESTIDENIATNLDFPVLNRDPSNIPLLPGEPILGNELRNPYDINNMENAYATLTGSTIQFTPTHYYIKFSPVDGEDIIEIETFEEEYGYEFETQPLHFQVLAEGKEDYIDPGLSGEGFSPEYGAVTQSDFTSGHLPDVPYVVLREMYIPLYETRLTFTAFVISGNQQYYVALEGLCHPDCPSWPDCLDDPTLTCQVGLGTGFIPTIDPMTTQPRENFPGYILDEHLGYFGELVETSSRIPIIPDDLDCPEGCIPILEMALTNQSSPYGDGSSQGAGRAELTEGMAYAFENIIADRKYGLLHSNSGFPNSNRYINLGERLRFRDNANEFIPSGLYFDLFDENGVYPPEMTEQEPNGVDDLVSNFPFETQVQIFGLPLMESIEQFQNRLWQFNGSTSGNTLNNYIQLFQYYGY